MRLTSRQATGGHDLERVPGADRCFACSRTIQASSSRATSFLTFIEDPHEQRRSRPRIDPCLTRLFQVLNTRQKGTASRPTLDEDLARFPYVNGDLFDGPACAFPIFRCRHAHKIAGRLPASTGRGHLARDLRSVVSVGHGRGGAPRAGRALHHREEHPEGDRTAVSWTTCVPSSKRLRSLERAETHAPNFERFQEAAGRG